MIQYWYPTGILRRLASSPHTLQGGLRIDDGGTEHHCGSSRNLALLIDDYLLSHGLRIDDAGTRYRRGNSHSLAFLDRRRSLSSFHVCVVRGVCVANRE